MLESGGSDLWIAAAAFIYLGYGLVVVDDGSGCCVLDELNSVFAGLFGVVAFAGVGEDFAVGGFQAPASSTQPSCSAGDPAHSSL